MAKLRERWVLHDFGTLQFLVDTFAAQVITLHGPGAITSDGPWELSVADDRQVLMSLDGQIDATEYMGTLATLVLEVDSNNEIVVLRDRTGSEPKEPGGATSLFSSHRHGSRGRRSTGVKQRS